MGTSSKSQFLAPFFFFLISLSYKLPWTAVSSLLSQFSREFGPQVLLQLNIAYFFPSIPVLIFQTMYNDRMDSRMGLRQATLLRFLTGLGGLTLLMAYFPYFATSHTSLLAATVMVGMSYGVAFGTSYQLASKFPAVCTVALTTGFVSSGPIILLFDLAIKRGPFYTPEGLAQLFAWSSMATGMGMISAVLLVLTSWRMLGSLQRGKVEMRVASRGTSEFGRRSFGTSTKVTSDWSFGRGVRHRSEQQQQHDGGDGGASHAINLEFAESGGVMSHSQGRESGGGYYEASSNGGPPGHRSSYSGSLTSSGSDKKDMSMVALALRISPSALSIFLSVGTSMIIFPFFTYMKSTGLLGVRLAQVLFYVRLISDIAGRMVPKRLQVNSVRGLLLWAAIKTAMVPLIFCSIFTPEVTFGDVGATLLVAGFWILSGYVNTCSYLVAPTLVPPSQKARASGMMTVAFQSSCFIALLLAAAIQQSQYGMPAGAAGEAEGLEGEVGVDTENDLDREMAVGEEAEGLLPGSNSIGSGSGLRDAGGIPLPAGGEDTGGDSRGGEELPASQQRQPHQAQQLDGFGRAPVQRPQARVPLPRVQARDLGEDVGAHDEGYGA